MMIKGGGRVNFLLFKGVFYNITIYLRGCPLIFWSFIKKKKSYEHPPEILKKKKKILIFNFF